MKLKQIGGLVIHWKHTSIWDTTVH